MDIPRKKDLTYIAQTNFRDVEKKFGIKRNDRRQHMYVLGKSGTGKSALLKNMIIQNIVNGEGLAVVDPHGELVEDILEMIPKERLDDVVYFNPADDEFHMGFNMLEVPDQKYKHLIASGLMGIFTKIWANVWSSRMEYILSNTILALIETPGTTMLAIPRMLVDADYRNYIIGNVTDPVVKSFWTNEFANWQEKFRSEAIAPIQNKVGQFLSTSLVRNIVGQQKSTIDIYDIMNTKKIVLVNVSKGRIGEDNSALLGAMMITKIQLAAMERVRIAESERKDFYLYVDEFQNFVTESFASILSEARKYRLCLTIAHQYIGQLSTADSVVVRDAVFGNVGSMITFRVGATDAEFIEKEFEPEFTTQDFVNLPNYHIYLKLMIDGVTSRPFSAKTLPPFDTEGSEGIKNEIIDRARELYAKPRAQVEEEISNWSSKKIRPSYNDVPSDPDEVIEDKDGKYRIKCSLFDECGNIAIVPFKPEKGRPVYCKEHIEKIKNEEEHDDKKNTSKETSPTPPAHEQKKQSVKETDSPKGNKDREIKENKSASSHQERKSNTTFNTKTKDEHKQKKSERPSDPKSSQVNRTSHNTPAHTPKTSSSMSLNDLHGNNTRSQKIASKDAGDTTRNSLKEAIMKATQDKNTPPKNAESAQDKASQTTKNNSQSITQESQPQHQAELTELQKEIAQLKKEQEHFTKIAEKKKQDQNASSSHQTHQSHDNPPHAPTPTHTPQSGASHGTNSQQPKEVPEDILKQMLE